MSYNNIVSDLKKASSKKKKEASEWFFKTDKGQYGAHDVFIGVTVPEQRKIAKRYTDVSLEVLEKLLCNKIHEYRLTALFILDAKFKKGNKGAKKKIFTLYIKNIKHINNWDLVDESAPKIVGQWMLLNTADTKRLYQWAVSKDLWKNRIAIIATYAFIKEGKYSDTLKISKILLQHPHDLIHKAVGWMLREVGNRDMETEEKFLKKYYSKMPRTMLRYAIEKFPESKRQDYLKERI